MKIKSIKQIIGISAGLLLSTSTLTNELLNAGFEDNPPATGWGNHIGYPIAPWILGAGQQSNVIRVDQASTYLPTSQGPQRDASNAPTGTVRHYLDIADGGNKFYQTFRAKCTGEAKFGGYFSTRANGPAQAQVYLRQGTGFNGTLVGQTNLVNLPAGSSATDPWVRVGFTAPIITNTTYSFIVDMDDNSNLDNAFVSVPNCPDDYPDDPYSPEEDANGGGSNGGFDIIDVTPIDVIKFPPMEEADSCCPPINKDVIMRQLTPVFQPNGGSNAKYRLNFSATPTFNNQMQNYLNYVHSMNPQINALITTWRVYDKAPGGLGSPVPTSAGLGTKIEEFFSTFHVTNPINHGNTSNVYQMKPNHWYRVQTGTYFNDGHKFFPKKCDSADYWVNWQVGAKSSNASGEFIIAQGGKIISRIPLSSFISTNESDKESNIFERRKCVKAGGTYFENSNGAKWCANASMVAKSMSEYEEKPMQGIFERRKCLRAGGVYMTNSNGSRCLQTLRAKPNSFKGKFNKEIKTSIVNKKG